MHFKIKVIAFKDFFTKNGVINVLCLVSEATGLDVRTQLTIFVADSSFVTGQVGCLFACKLLVFMPLGYSSQAWNV